LKRGRFVALGPALSRRPLPITIGAVETEARSTSPKLTPLPEAPAPEEARDLIFTPGPQETATVVRRPPPPPRPTNDILAELAKAGAAGAGEANADGPAAEAAPEMPEEERDRLIDGLLAAIVADPDAAFRSDGELYQDFLVRARIARLPGQPVTLTAFRRRFALARAGIDAETAAGEDWRQVLALAEALPEDVQAVFVLVAKAALSGGVCPPDATLARAYGTHSTRRARRLLDYFEERGLVVVRTDFAGKRIVAFPDIGCETLPGAADGPDLGFDRSAA